MNTRLLVIAVISFFYVKAYNQSFPLVIATEYEDESSVIMSANDSSFYIIRRESIGLESDFYLTQFNLYGEILNNVEVIQDPTCRLDAIYSFTRDQSGNYYAYGMCKEIDDLSESQTFVLKYSSDFEFMQSYTIGRPDISEYVRDLYFVNNTFFLAGFSTNASGDFLYKLDTNFNIIDELIIDTVAVFGPSKLAMDFDGNELIMFMYTKKAYYIDTSTLMINSTFFIEDVNAYSLREVMPLTESERFVMPYLVPPGVPFGNKDLTIQFRDKDLNLINESLISNDTMSIIQAQNTLNYLDDNIWLCFTTYRETIEIFSEEINHPIGVMKFSPDGEILHEGYIDGNANFIAYAALALADGGAIILTSRYDWTNPETDRDIYIFRVDADGDLILDMENSPIQQFDFLVYPNPVSDYLIIKSQLIQSAFVEIYNMNGQLVNRNEKLSTELKIDLSSLSSGIYTYRIFTEKGLMQSGKFVKNN
ncbi:MAG: T9SS type A sorting domain-containing protein [Bacteroidetes bacterium]|nr:T9SS type A sorting domain-containing protein [Bacteroidota bacterium]MBP7399544.1 T9SS type A sorting domain-containing protein [Chitinophagales bacterium]MBK7108662.1 T9SS type A sorting domain-containing protein [Bacteroidota bacterium]MBK8489012.1 T9SS type A sorting domain-containing protein [Bacteroidota bacterium]MBK8680862.1 T9SS type A sorting domain-containing protein [Bacteroidota bacterium]